MLYCRLWNNAFKEQRIRVPILRPTVHAALIREDNAVQHVDRNDVINQRFRLHLWIWHQVRNCIATWQLSLQPNNKFTGCLKNNLMLLVKSKGRSGIFPPMYCIPSLCTLCVVNEICFQHNAWQTSPRGKRSSENVHKNTIFVRNTLYLYAANAQWLQPDGGDPAVHGGLPAARRPLRRAHAKGASQILWPNQGQYTSQISQILRPHQSQNTWDTLPASESEHLRYFARIRTRTP